MTTTPAPALYKIRIASTRDSRVYGNRVKALHKMDGEYDGKTKTWVVSDNCAAFRVERRYDEHFDAGAYITAAGLEIID